MAQTPKLQDLLAGPRIVRVVDWPGRPEVQVGLRVLTGAEQQDALFEAAKRFQLSEGVGVTAATLDGYQDHVSTCRLARALVAPEPPHASLCATGAELQKWLTDAEKEALLREYLDLEAALNPDLEAMGRDEALALLDGLRKNAAGWRVLRPDTQRRLLHTLAGLQWISPPDSGSPSLH